MRKFLLMASACKEPPQAALPGLLAGVSGKLRDIGQTVKRNEWEKHTKTCSEGAQCLNWLCVKPAPRDFIESFIGGSDYWANNIRREFRTTNPDQIAFCDTFKALILELMTYVKEFHTTGVAWNPRGTDASTYSAVDSQAAVPPPAAAAVADTKAGSAKPAPTADLFAALNKDGAVTSGLKKVTKDQQTWRAEYKADAASPAPAAKPLSAPVAKPAVVKGPPRNQFDAGAKKWCIEYQTDANGPVVVTIGDIKENVYILGCVGATISVVGKCKSIIVDSCKKTKVHFDNVMASCEVVNSQRILIEVREKAPSIAIDKTDGIVVQLPLSSLDTSVVASKSSEMNISWPDSNGDLMERPIPEQYVHRIIGSSISAEVSDLYGH
jgi:adenylyl cyclase-associated protein